MPFHLLPRDERFVGMFHEAAQKLSTAAETLLALLTDYRDVESTVRRIEALEHEGDRLTHSIFEALHRAFVTPFDREDIAQLASALDNVLDDTEEAARRLYIYRIEQPTELSTALCRVLVAQCQRIGSAMPLLDGLRDTTQLREHIVELHRLENEADELMDRALAGLYTGVTEVPALVRAVQWGDIYAVLERATDRAEDVAVALETILVKNA